MFTDKVGQKPSLVQHNVKYEQSANKLFESIDNKYLMFLGSKIAEYGHKVENMTIQRHRCTANLKKMSS